MSFLRYLGMVFSVVVVFVVFMSIGLYMMWRGICTGDLSLYRPRF